LPSGKLPREHAPELLGKARTLTGQLAVYGLWTFDIQEGQLAGLPAKAVDAAIQDPRLMLLDGQNAPRKAAIFMPGIDPEPVGTNLEDIIGASKGHQRIPVFKQSRATAAFQEGANRLLKFSRVRIIVFCHRLNPIWNPALPRWNSGSDRPPNARADFAATLL
jgi:hypothetical protein